MYLNIYKDQEEVKLREKKINHNPNNKKQMKD